MHIIEYPPIPMETPIYGGMNNDARIDIHGEPYAGYNNGFVVELLTHEGIAFHMSNRMSHGGGEHTIVLNTMKHGHWEHEDRHCQVFRFNHHFHLSITRHHNHFSIHVNGDHLCKFHIRHHHDIHHIRALAIRGDVRVSKVHFEHFHGHNGGGVSIGGGVAVAPMMAPPIGGGVTVAPVMVQQPMMPSPIIVAPPPRQPTIIVEPIIRPRPVVVIETDRHHHGHHHHHHHHGHHHGHH